MATIKIALKSCMVMASLVAFTSYGQRQSENSYRSSFGPNALVGYYAYFPEEYHSNPTKKFPILIFLHGMGEKVWNPKDLSQLSKVKMHGPPRLIEEGQDFPFIVISPQCPFASWDEVTTDGYKTSVMKPGEFVDEILEKMKSLYRIDPSRVYITGLSMGGAGTWTYTAMHPEKVAASIPIAGWIGNYSLCPIAQNNVAVWAFQGQYDGGVGMLGTVTRLNTCLLPPLPLARATIYPGVGHDAWTRTYNNTGIAPENIYEWLMRQKKSVVVTNAPPVANAGDDRTVLLTKDAELELEGVGEDSDGEIVSYKWEKVSGPLVKLSDLLSRVLSLKNLSSGTYVFRLTVEDNDGATATDEVSISVKDTEYVAGTGFQAEYFGNINLKGKAITQTDSLVNFDWGKGAPTPGIAADRFSVRWTSKIKPEESDTFTFYTITDDGVRLWVDNKLIIDNWTYHSVTENSAEVTLEAGIEYDIKMEYFESAGGAVAKLLWSSSNISKQVIPAKVLFLPEASSDGAITTAGLSVYPSPAVDEVLVTFQATKPVEAVIKVVDDFSLVRVQKTLQVDAGTHTATLSLTEVPSGIYYVVTTIGDVQERIKLIVLK